MLAYVVLNVVALFAFRVIRLPQLFPQEEQTEDQGLGSEPKAEQETVRPRHYQIKNT